MPTPSHGCVATDRHHDWQTEHRKNQQAEECDQEFHAGAFSGST
jgi:hypothetical protein